MVVDDAAGIVDGAEVVDEVVIGDVTGVGDGATG